jgi:DNA-binding CsgD family transcriptional regulator
VLPLEREIELEAIAELVAGAADGRGGLLVVEGVAGVGKSTLVAYAAQAARDRGLTVLQARGHELERAFGWGVARLLLEASLTDDLLTGPAQPARVVFGEDAESASDGGFGILHSLYWVTVRLAERGPLVLAVDDAHWADEASLRYLIYLAGRLTGQPIALLVATRPVDDDLLAHLASDADASIRVVEPLGADAVAELVRRKLPDAGDRFCRRCWELTGGNPLQVRELLRATEGPADDATLAAAAETAARSLGRSVLRRLGALSPAAQALARAVAVYEDDAPLRLAAALADLAPVDAVDAAEALERADVLRAGDPLGFSHPLLRAAVYGQLTFVERARTHRRAASLLGEEGASDERVSAHLMQSVPAGDAGAVMTLRAAARRALGQGVPRSAVAYLDRALREPPPAEDRPGVLAELGQAEAVAGRPEAVEHLEAAVALASKPATRAALLLDFGRALHHSGRIAAAGDAFLHGLEDIALLEQDLASDLEGAYLTSAMHIPLRAADAHRRGDAILAALRFETRADRALASKAMMMRLFACAPHDELVAIARELSTTDGIAADSRTPSYVVGTLVWCDDYQAARDGLEAMFLDARRRGSVRRYAMASQLRARQSLWTGSIDDAVADARAAVDVWHAGGEMYLHAAGYCLVSALLERDEPGEAATALAACDEQPPASGFFAAWRHAAAARLAAHTGDDRAALEAFLAAGRGLTELAIVNPTVLTWRSEAGLAALRLGQRDLARSLISEEVQLAGRFGAPRAIGIAGRAAALLEQGDTPIAGLASAADTLAACGAHVDHARTLVDLGAAIRRAGRRADARRTLRRALTLAEDAGAAALARCARDELRLAGGRARAMVGATGGLTPSEHRVAALAAAGQSNRQIADALFLTVKSVEWHLGNAYRKLDIRGRGELAGRLG